MDFLWLTITFVCATVILGFFYALIKAVLRNKNLSCIDAGFAVNKGFHFKAEFKK